MESSTPAAGASVDVAPTKLQLRFTENISAEFAQLALIRGEEPAQRLTVQVSGPVATAEVPPLPGTGDERVQWQVSYRVVSADGHPITGTIDFTAPTGAAPSPSLTTRSPSEAPGADTDGTADGVDDETDDGAGAAAAGADQRDADDSGLSPSIVTAAIAVVALAVTAAAMVVSARRRSGRPR